MSLRAIHKKSTILTALLCVNATFGQSSPVSPPDIGGAQVAFKLKSSQTAGKPAGVLTVDGSSVSYAEANGKTSKFMCADFLAGASVRKDKTGSILVMPVSLHAREMWPDGSMGISPEGVLGRIKAECAKPGASADLAFSDGVTYQIAWMGREREFDPERVASVPMEPFRSAGSTFAFPTKHTLHGTLIIHVQTWIP